MATTMNKWRNVNYTDDGCTLYQCLSCMNKFEGRTGPVRFCTFCGTEWEGQHEARPSGTPRWLYDRYGGEGFDAELATTSGRKRLWESRPKQTEWEWVVETRTNWGQEWGQWERVVGLRYTMGSFKYAKDVLCMKRAESKSRPYKQAFRVRLVKK